MGRDGLRKRSSEPFSRRTDRRRHLCRGDLEFWVQGTPRFTGDGAHEVLRTSALRRPKRSVDLEPMSPPKNTIKKGVFNASNCLGNILETILFLIKHYAYILHSVFLLSMIYLIRQT